MITICRQFSKCREFGSYIWLKLYHFNNLSLVSWLHYLFFIEVRK